MATRHYCDCCRKQVEVPIVVEFLCHLDEAVGAQYTDSECNACSGRTVKVDCCPKCYNDAMGLAVKRLKEIQIQTIDNVGVSSDESPQEVPSGSDLERFKMGLNNPHNRDEVCEIVAAALALERTLYSREPPTKFIYRLRKALEGIWGHDLPTLDEFGNPIP